MSETKIPKEKIICQICGKLCKSKRSISAHLRYNHKKITINDYWKKYFSEPKNLIDKHNRLQCQICGKICKGIDGVAPHLKWNHNMKIQDYYNEFFKKNDSECKCKECNKETSYIGLNKGYNIFCSYKCRSNNKEVKKKITFTKLNNIDDDGNNSFQRSIVKIKETKLNNIDDDGNNSFQRSNLKLRKLWRNYSNEKIKEIHKKIKETKLSSIDENGNNSFQRSTIKNKETCIKKYGVSHTSQVPAIADKILKNCYKSKEYKLPSGKIIKLQGYEPQALNILLETFNEDDILTDRKDMPEIWYYTDDGKKHRYYPDMYIQKENLIIEVKSNWTYKKYLDINLLKEKACLDAGYNFKFMIL